MFRPGNLMEPFHFKRPFDLIFCRNVMIYFDGPTKDGIINKFYDWTSEGGFLFTAIWIFTVSSDIKRRIPSGPFISGLRTNSTAPALRASIRRALAPTPVTGIFNLQSTREGAEPYVRCRRQDPPLRSGHPVPG